MYTPEGYKGVCYRCSYESQDGREQRCPICCFPFILEAETTPAGGRRLESVLHRASVRAGAPPLPGVDAEKRKAQLLSESRKRRETERRQRTLIASVLEPVAVQSRRGSGTRLVGRLTFALLCVSAVAAGAVAAVLQHGT